MDRLQLSQPKIRSLDGIETIEDLQWARRMDYLDLFSFVDTNVIDGDMTPLLELPHLRYVGTMSKRHYSHSFEQLLELLEGRRRNQK